MTQARSISNHDERRSLYVEIQRTLLDDSPNWWWYAKLNIEAHVVEAPGLRAVVHRTPDLPEDNLDRRLNARPDRRKPAWGR